MKKVAIITGGNSGIGGNCSKLLAKDGNDLIINYLDDDILAQETKRSCEEVGAEVILVKGDVSSADIRSQIIKAVSGRDILALINCAGMAYDKDWKDKTEEEWLKTYHVNVVASSELAKSLAANLISSKSSVVNISSTNGIDALSTFSMDYDASKSAMINMTKNYAQALAPHVRVNAIAPGWVNTKFNHGLDNSFLENEVKKIALGRIAQPEEITSIVKFLISEDASYINGAVIVADGGKVY